MSEDKIELKAHRIYWDEKDTRIAKILGNGQVSVSELQQSDLLYLVKEFDRRLVQLWDKATFEADRKLVNYSEVWKELELTSGYAAE